MGGLLPPAERGSGALLAFYAAVSLILLVSGTRIPAASLRGVGAFVFAPLDRVVLVVDRLAAGWRENQRLEWRVTELELENQRLRERGVENERLRAMLDLPQVRGVTLKPVEVLSLSGDPIPVAATVSAGFRSGIHRGDIVVTRDGLVGRVSEAYPYQSRVALLADPNSAVACEVESTGVLGMVKFVSAPLPRLMMIGIPLTDTVRVGERVLTSGLSLRYPRDLPVGTIARIVTDPNGLMQNLELEPAAHVSRLRHGFVIPGPGETSTQ